LEEELDLSVYSSTTHYGKYICPIEEKMRFIMGIQTLMKRINVLLYYKKQKKKTGMP